jgi:rod shape-determining protein MreD
LFAVALLQVTLMPHLTVSHVQPDLVLAVVVCWALIRGPSDGALWGFLAGIATDLLSGAPFGMHTFVMTVMGIVAGLGADVIPSEHAMLLPGVAMLCTVLQQAVYVLMLRGAGWPIDWSKVLVPVVIPSAVLNLILALLLYPLVGRLHRRLAPEEPGW